MTSKLDLLEVKIRKAAEELTSLRKANGHLKSENESLKSQIALTSGDTRKTQRILAEYDTLKRNQAQALGKVERALTKLNAMRLQ